MINAKPAIARGATANLSVKLYSLKTCLLVLAGLAGILVSGDWAHAQIPSMPPMPPEKVVEILGQHIHYYEAGEGENIILLHGLGAEADIWAANIPALSPHYHVVVPDQIGFGNSDKPPIEYKIQTWVEFLDLFMQALNISKATLVGNSLGGWIAVDFARQHPEKVAKLVLADAGGWRPIKMPPPMAKSLNDASIAGIRQVIEMMLFERRAIPINLNPGSLQETRKMLEFIVSDKQLITDQMVEQEFQRHLKIGDGITVERFLAGSLAEDQFENEKVRNLTVPTLIVWGRDDRLFSLDEARAFGKAIHGSKLVVIEQCGHMPQLEKSAEFNKALLEYLSGS
ncbi:MAG: alpha/beta hydrolase [Terriglobia bacterium]|jgi:triacylglycerol lipase